MVKRYLDDIFISGTGDNLGEKKREIKAKKKGIIHLLKDFFFFFFFRFYFTDVYLISGVTTVADYQL